MRTRSFTLIELLIVLVIIGILAVLAIPQYRSYINKAKTMDEMARLLKAITMLKATTGYYPGRWPYDSLGYDNISTLEGWKSPRSGLVETDDGYPNWCGPYIEGPDDVFLDPWGKAYYYDGSPDVSYEWNVPGNVAIASAGPDGIFEGEGPPIGRPWTGRTFNNPDRIAQGDDIAIYCN